MLIFRDAPDPALPDAALPDQLDRSGHPILLLRANGDGNASPPGEEIGEVLQFLAEGVHPAAGR